MTDRTPPLIADAGAAHLRDLRDGIGWMEPVGPALDPAMIEALDRLLDKAQADLAGLVIAPRRGPFLAQADYGDWLTAANLAAWWRIADGVRRAQDVVARLAGGPIPVVALVTGAARDGGAELALHCDAVLARDGATLTFDHIARGLIPCRGALARSMARAALPDGSLAETAAEALFAILSEATAINLVADGTTRLGLAVQALQAEGSGALGEAKASAQALADRRQDPAGTGRPPDRILRLPGSPLYGRLVEQIDIALFRGGRDPGLQAVLTELAVILSGGDVPPGQPMAESEIRALERDVVGFLLRRPATLARLGRLGRPTQAGSRDHRAA